jgi:hypothetical protein
MSRNIRQLRIFIASPSDCRDEREIVRRLAATDPTIKTLQRDLGISVDVYGWEDVVPEGGRPQSIINAAIEKYDPDWFVFIFWHRFGIDAGEGMTGTEEEWNIARDHHEKGKGRPHISLYFNKARPSSLEIDNSQQNALANFKQKIFGRYEALAGHFEDSNHFETTFRAHLATQILELREKLPPAAYFRDELLAASKSLLMWPTTLGRGEHIDRPELLALLERIQGSESSSTLVLGSPGTGKSALLASLANHLMREGIPFLAIKADMVGSGVDSFKNLGEWLNLTVAPQDALRTVAASEKVVLIIDQLDAVSELLDRKSERLNVILNFIHSLARTPGVHIIGSSREFEFRHDIRLTSIDAERVDLNLPAWEQVAPILLRGGHDPERMGDPLRDLLRVPLHLKLFLEVAVPGAEFESLQGLLDALWNKHVINPEGPEERVTLLEQLALRMADEETLWLPSAVADNYSAARQTLEQAEILARGPNNVTIGFRHQTYYDHALARSFARGTLPFARYVLERQDGLFVRPTLLAGLNYLRASSRAEYHRQLKELFSSSLRLHLRMLVIEFLGGLKDPDDLEAQIVLPLLGSENEAPRVLRSIANSPGWFLRLKTNPLFHDWLSSQPEKAAHCGPIMSSAARFANEDVLNLLEGFWLKDNAYDALSLSVLLEFEDWNTRMVSIAEKLVRRGQGSSEMLAERVAERLPDEAPRIIRAEFDRELQKTLTECEEQALELREDIGKEKTLTDDFSAEKYRPLSKLIERREGWYNLEEFAERAPKAFLHHLWPWFLEIVQRIAEPEHRFVLGYRCDTTSYSSFEGDLEPVDIVRAFLTAITGLVTTDEHRFLKFLDQNTECDLKVVHRLLARGLEILAPRRPQIVLEYLIADTRRLNIGDMHDDQLETKRLIKAVCPHLTQDALSKLETAVRGYTKYKRRLDEWSPKERFQRNQWDRQRRLNLLRVFPEECLSPETKKLRAEEERVFPKEREEFDRTPGLLHTVGARLTAAEMARASDEELLRLFDQLPDSSGWDNPKRQWSSDLSRAGGAIQQAREFGELAKQNPLRVGFLISRLEPGRHETYAGEALQGLANTDFPKDEVIRLIHELDKRGFNTTAFREDAGSALEKIASRNKGLPDAILNRLQEWIKETAEPRWPPSDEAKRPGQKADEEDGSILYGYSRFQVLSHGRGNLVRAVAAGYLERDPPDIDNWTRHIQSQLVHEKHPDIWAETLIRMPILFGGDHEQATNLFDAVIEACPGALRHPFGLHGIARVLRWLKPIEKGEEWLDKLMLYGSSALEERERKYFAQAYGELLPLFHCCHLEARSRARIRDYLTGSRNVYVDRGLAYAAADLWATARCQEMATHILCTLASSEDRSTQGAIAGLFRLKRDSFELNQNMRTIINNVRANPPVLLLAAEDLVEAIEPLTGIEPEFVSQVCADIIRFGAKEVGRPSGSWIFVSENLTNIALTLHRQEAYREVGLELFEQLISLNVQEARAALEVLDRKPARLVPHRYRPRRRRRKRNR